MPLRGFSVDFPWLETRKQAIYALNGRIVDELKEEKDAEKTYRQLARLADTIGWKDIADKLRTIAEDTGKHCNILDEILTKIAVKE